MLRELVGLWGDVDFLASRDWSGAFNIFVLTISSRWFALLLMAAGFAWLARIAATPSAIGVQVEGGVVLLAPLDGARVPRTFAVSGLAATFESNVIVEDLGPDGRWTLVGGPTTAEAPEFGLGPRFEIEVSLPPGRHRLRVGDSSGGEGEFHGPEFVVRVK